jgi:NAD(P)-dependent dehydrogenase (short-subunit alcohol dehydrogenase family)
VTQHRIDAVFRLDDDVAVVTGALGRLGPVWVEALIHAGAKVAALDLPTSEPSAAFEALVDRVNSTRLFRVDCDITDRSTVETALKKVASQLGVPTVLVNNAGLDQPPDKPGSRYRVSELPVELFSQMVAVNLTGTFLVTQVIGGEMASRGRGSVVNIGSLYASVSPDQRFYDHLTGDPPFVKTPAYGASKAAVVNLTKYFATLWGPQGVRVNTLSPGGVKASQDERFLVKYGQRVPLGRMAESGDLGGPLVFLASEASAYVTGINLRVDGGFTAW